MGFRSSAMADLSSRPRTRDTSVEKGPRAAKNPYPARPPGYPDPIGPGIPSFPGRPPLRGLFPLCFAHGTGTARTSGGSLSVSSAPSRSRPLRATTEDAERNPTRFPVIPVFADSRDLQTNVRQGHPVSRKREERRFPLRPAGSGFPVSGSTPFHKTSAL